MKQKLNYEVQISKQIKKYKKKPLKRHTYKPSRRTTTTTTNGLKVNREKLKQFMANNITKKANNNKMKEIMEN